MGEHSNGLISRNVKVSDKRTSIRLERQMWTSFKSIAERENCTIHDLCSLIASNKKKGISLTASIRIFIMMYFKAAATEIGHRRAGHGCFSEMQSRIQNMQDGGKKQRDESSSNVQEPDNVHVYSPDKVPDYSLSDLGDLSSTPLKKRSYVN